MTSSRPSAALNELEELRGIYNERVLYERLGFWFLWVSLAVPYTYRVRDWI